MSVSKIALGDGDAIWECGECGTQRMSRESAENCCSEPPAAGASDDSPANVREHYERVRPVYEALGEMAGNPTIMLNDFAGWYIEREAGEPHLRELGYTGVARPATFDDYDALASRVERTMYAITSYKLPSALKRQTAYKWEGGDRVWASDERKTPTYGEIVAYPLFGDIDLTKTKDSDGEVRGIREMRFAGDLDAETKTTVEAAIEAYIDEYAKVYGGRSGVQALDSGGGVYVFGPPEATLPITREFSDDEQARDRIFRELRSREKEYLQGAEERVCERVPGAEDIISPDWCNNGNRQYKAPLSLHKKDDVLVTPIDTGDVDFSLTRAEDFDDELLADAVGWAESYTSVEHADAVESLVATLWEDEYDETGDWRKALREWLEAEQKVNTTAETPPPLRGTTDGEVTPNYHEVADAADRLDAQRVAEQTIVHKWNDAAATSGNHRAFYPTWGKNSNGNANIVNEDIWQDTGSGGWGGVVEMALISANELKWRQAEPVGGAKWARGVRELRKLGFDVPMWTPDATTRQARDGKMPYWALRNAAVALGVLNPGDFVERESGDGGTYLGFPDAGTYNAALDAAEEAGLKHGRERAGDGRATPTRKQLDIEEVAEDDEEKMKQLHAELKIMD